MGLCDDDKKAEIQKFMAMDDAALQDLIDGKIKEQEDAEQHFKDQVSELQKNYEALSKAKDDAIKAVKDSGLGLMKAVKASQ